jgi:ribonuclease-3
VLGLVVGERLYRHEPGAGPGSLTARRAELVSARSLATWARTLALGPCLRLGRGEEQSGGREKDSILASALEAMIGAVYLDGGLEAVEVLVRDLMAGEEAGGGSAA